MNIKALVRFIVKVFILWAANIAIEMFYIYMPSKLIFIKKMLIAEFTYINENIQKGCMKVMFPLSSMSPLSRCLLRAWKV